MRNKQQELWWHFKDVLGELSIAEITANKEMIIRAELIEFLFLKMAI